MMKRLLILLTACLVLLCPVARAEEPATPREPVLVDKGLDLGTASVHWPQVEGMADETLQAAINGILSEAAGAPALTGRMGLVMNAEPALTAGWEGEIRGDVLSCSLYAEGPLETDRFRSVRRGVTIDLRTGEPVALADLFADPEEALAALEDTLSETVAPELSAHLANSDLLPLPEDFVITPAGLTLLYPASQLSTLSDRAGAVTLSWHELPALDGSEDGIPARFGLTAVRQNDGDALMACFAEGSIPGIPAAIGDEVTALTERWHLPAEPDLYEGGRYVQLEDSRFRGCWIMTDDLGAGIKDFTGSKVHGIRADRFSLYGLTTGQSEREEVRELLGDPLSVVELDRDAADAMRLPEGVSEYRQAGEYRLRLHFDTDGTLVSVFLLP